jgi:DNA-binding HxlR family transcriptional regulator
MAHRCEQLVADCRVRAATDVLAHTWHPVVLAALRAGPRRRIDLRQGIGGISDKSLTQALARLIAMSLVSRTRFAEAPPRVEYALTDLGRSFADGPLAALGTWAAAHGEELLPDEDDLDEAGGAT